MVDMPRPPPQEWGCWLAGRVAAVTGAETEAGQTDRPERRIAETPFSPRGPTIAGAALAAVLVVAAASIVSASRDILPPTTLPLIFLMAVLVSAVVSGFWVGVATAAAAFVVMNFLFTEPFFTLHVSRPQDIVTLGVFLCAAGLVGSLAGNLRDRADSARTRAETLSILAAFSARLAEVDTREAALGQAVTSLSALAGGNAVAVDVSGLPFALAAVTNGGELSVPDAQAAERCLRSGRIQPATAEGWQGAALTFVPVPDGTGTLALGHGRLSGADTAQRSVAVSALVEQLALALRRLDASSKEMAARQDAETEATRSALLASLSHDLRTPLATILGAASTLSELHDGLSDGARADLLAAISQEAGRLNLHVTNLLQMTRLSRTIVPHLAWVDVNDIAQAAIARLRRAFPEVDCRCDLAELPMIRAEGGLLEQMLFNLIDNALKHGTAPITLRTGQTGDTITVAVSDAGSGPAPALRDWLQAAQMWPTADQRGLGLAVAKCIARVHGGGLRWSDGALRVSLPLVVTT